MGRTGLVFAAIAPDGGIAIAEACSPDEREVAIKTREGMEELGRRFALAKPEVVVVATPHNVHISNALAVIVAARLKGRRNRVTPPLRLEVRVGTGRCWRASEWFGASASSTTASGFGSSCPSHS